MGSNIGGGPRRCASTIRLITAALVCHCVTTNERDGDINGAGLNDKLALQIALGEHQSLGAVQGDVVAREGGDREREGSQDSLGNRSS